MAIVIKRTKYPKMANGGIIDTSFFDNMPEQNLNFQDYAGGMGTEGSEQLANGIQTGIQAIPVWGQIAGLGMELGQQIGKNTKDEFGIYKNKGSEVVDNIFNPTTHIQGIKDVFKDPSLENIGNKLSFGLIGKSSSQRKLEHLRDVFKFDKSMGKMVQNQRAGAAAHASLPEYQAPRYGKQGMKLTPRYSTKFSNRQHGQED